MSDRFAGMNFTFPQTGHISPLGELPLYIYDGNLTALAALEQHNRSNVGFMFVLIVKVGYKLVIHFNVSA